MLVATLVAGLTARLPSRAGGSDFVVAACLLATLVRPRLRPLLTLGAPACLAVTALYVIVQQRRYRYPYDFFWVEHFSAVQNLAWLAVLLLAAGAFVDFTRLRRRKVRRTDGYGRCTYRFVVTWTSRLRSRSTAVSSSLRFGLSPMSHAARVEHIDHAGARIEAVEEQLLDLIAHECIAGITPVPIPIVMAPRRLMRGTAPPAPTAGVPPGESVHCVSNVEPACASTASVRCSTCRPIRR